ncbi:MAG: hypothetical protein GPJ50_03270 [Candidatus Heimdallarchaeota archaeon]|nr:hypothetical protein [Candidatus Heimdallarchaeota archaeon]
MAKEEIHEEDIGTIFEVTVKEDGSVVDVSTATTKEFHFKKPSGEILSKPTDFVTNGTDGKLKYTTIANDLDESGGWSIQVYLVLSSGTWSSDIIDFMVYKNIKST